MVIGAERFGVRPRGKEQHGPRHRRRQRSTASTLLVASALDVTPIQPPRISALDRTDFAGGGHEPDRAILESALDDCASLVLRQSVSDRTYVEFRPIRFRGATME